MQNDACYVNALLHAAAGMQADEGLEQMLDTVLVHALNAAVPAAIVSVELRRDAAAREWDVELRVRDRAGGDALLRVLDGCAARLHELREAQGVYICVVPH